VPPSKLFSPRKSAKSTATKINELPHCLSTINVP
jgi:hypothetical protein